MINSAMSFAGMGLPRQEPTVLLPEQPEPSPQTPIVGGMPPEQELADFSQPQYQTPSVRLHVKMGEARAAKQSQARAQDEALMPTILRDMQASEERNRRLVAEMEGFYNRLNAPAPVRQMPQLNQGEMLAAGLATLFGGRADDAVASAMRTAGARTDLDYQNAVTAYNADRDGALRGLDFTQRQALMEMQTGRGLEEDRRRALAGAEARDFTREGWERDEANARENRTFQASQQELTRAEDRFFRADNEGEVIQAAEDLQRLGKPVSREALAGAVDAARQKGRSYALQAYNQTIRPQVDFYQGIYPPGVLEGLERSADELRRRYGVDLPPIPGGASWKAQEADRNRAYKSQVLDERRRYHEGRFRMQNQQFRERIVQMEADRELARQRIAIAQQNANTAQGRLDWQKSRQDADAITEKLLLEARREGQRLSRDKAGVDAEIRDLMSPKGGGKLSLDQEKRLGELRSKRERLKGEINDNNRLLEEYRSEAPPPPSGTTQPAGGGGSEMKTSSGAKVRF